MPREFKPIYRTKVNDVYIRVDKVTGKCIVPNCKDTDCYDIQLEKPEGLSFMGGTLCRRHFEDIFNAYSSYNSIKTELNGDMISRQAEPMWIPVSEKLPEEGKEVLTCSNGGFIEIQSFENSHGNIYWENKNGDWTDIDEVIAWMPLPKPYKAESEE